MRLFLLSVLLWSLPGSLLLALQDTNKLPPLIPDSTPAELIRQGKFSEARVLLDSLLKANPASSDLLYQLGRIDLAERKFKDAEDAFQRAHELNPANLPSLMGIVETNMAQNKTDEALKILQAEIEKAPNRLDLQLAIGNTAVRAGKLDFAIQTFNKLVEQVDNGAKQGDVYLRLGETYRRKGDSAAAIRELQKAREFLPDNVVVLNTLAMVLDQAGRKPEAAQVYQAAVKLDPDNAVVLNNLAFLLAETGGDLDDALAKALRARQFLPDLREISDTLGWIYLKKNLTDNAIEIFIDLVGKEPGRSTFHYHLGLAYSQKGDKTKALEQLREALQYNPSEEEQKMIQRTIDRLGLIGYQPPARGRALLAA
jgi:tetratricopeptide (TPR) repeat protein